MPVESNPIAASNWSLGIQSLNSIQPIQLNKMTKSPLISEKEPFIWNIIIYPRRFLYHTPICRGNLETSINMLYGCLSNLIEC